jgi:hypothetical protein
MLTVELFCNDQSCKRSDLCVRLLHAARPRHRLFRRTVAHARVPNLYRWARHKRLSCGPASASTAQCPPSPAASRRNAASRKSPSGKCEHQAFAVSWSIAQITGAAIRRRLVATVGRTISGFPILSRYPFVRLRAPRRRYQAAVRLG